MSLRSTSMNIRKKSLIPADRSHALRRIVRMVMGMVFMTITLTVISKGLVNMEYRLIRELTGMTRKCGNDCGCEALFKFGFKVNSYFNWTTIRMGNRIWSFGI